MRGLEVAVLAMTLITGCGPRSAAIAPGGPAPVVGVARKIVDGARAQLKNPARYDASYRSLKYPGGDVKPDRGACTDVVIRALRSAGYDLQKLIHEDMKKNFRKYPRRGERPDPNIDHRRVPNQRTFFSRFGVSLGLSDDWQPGDIVTWKLDSGLDHTGVVVDEKGDSGDLMVVHNLGQTAMEDVLHAWTITGHYRYPRP